MTENSKVVTTVRLTKSSYKALSKSAEYYGCTYDEKASLSQLFEMVGDGQLILTKAINKDDDNQAENVLIKIGFTLRGLTGGLACVVESLYTRFGVNFQDISTLPSDIVRESVNITLTCRLSYRLEPTDILNCISSLTVEDLGEVVKREAKKEVKAMHMLQGRFRSKAKARDNLTNISLVDRKEGIFVAVNLLLITGIELGILAQIMEIIAHEDIPILSVNQKQMDKFSKLNMTIMWDEDNTTKLKAVRDMLVHVPGVKKVIISDVAKDTRFRKVIRLQMDDFEDDDN